MDETYYRDQLEARDQIIASLSERNRQLEVALEEAYAAGARKVMPAVPPPRHRTRLRVIKGGLAAVLGAAAGLRWALRAHRAGAVAALLTAATGAGVAIPVMLAPMSGAPGGALALRPAHHLRRGRLPSSRVPARSPSQRPGAPVPPSSGTLPSGPQRRTPAATAEATVTPGPSASPTPAVRPTRTPSPGPSPTVTTTSASPSPSPTQVPPGSGCTLYVLDICLKL